MDNPSHERTQETLNTANFIFRTTEMEFTTAIEASLQEASTEYQQKGKRRHESIAEEEDVNDSIDFYQPTIWWTASTTFPLIAGTFGPIANLFSVCALVQTWRLLLVDLSRIPDPTWLKGMNACSLVVGWVANLTLLFNFARRIRYPVAQPITISLWYLACILLVIPVVLTNKSNIGPYPKLLMGYSQSYYYAMISACIYFVISTLLLLSTLGATVLKKYPPTFCTLTSPQRTLMLQTISFSLYLAFGAGVFSKIENWGFADGVYWAQYTLLTVGLGTDFPLTTTLGRTLLIPYAAMGITLVGLVVSSVRGLILERGKEKVVRGHLLKWRCRLQKSIKEYQELQSRGDSENGVSSNVASYMSFQSGQCMKGRGKGLSRLPNHFAKHVLTLLSPKNQREASWAEFQLMRHIESSTENFQRNTSLGISFFLILVVWIGGSLIFWACERRAQDWTYAESIYFTYTTLLTIGYGDFYPNSAAGKPFFVAWSLISVPAMTVFISNMGDTVVKWVQDATVWLSSWTILPERQTQDSEECRLGQVDRMSHRGNIGCDFCSDKTQAVNGNIQGDLERHNTNTQVDVEGRAQASKVATLIAQEISGLSKDLTASPLKKYSWIRWQAWLKCLGELEDDCGPSAHAVKQGLHPAGADGSLMSTEERQQATAIPSIGLHYANPGPRQIQTIRDAFFSDRERCWTWLSNSGPLFSRLTETEWIIEKLCLRLEKLLEEDI